jgi:spermidine/putrescine transport system ATP-binding protein
MSIGESVHLDQVTMRFGDFTAVDDVSLEIRAGEFFSFLGPSGCGKTTILRMISGFSEPSAGRVLIGGRDMRGIGPNKRPTALIFQNLALFPLMPVWENVAFGLEMRGLSRTQRRQRAEELLELVALQEAADKKVADLSGGQRQRVAIARALAVEPKVMLLDEPLSALDLKLRQHMRAELRAIQRRTGVTFIYITHDQGEALTMSDRVAVMSRGRIEQVAKPQAIYNAPETAFAASFVGEVNVFRGRVTSTTGSEVEIETDFGPMRALNARNLGQGDRAMLFVRPERASIASAADSSGQDGGRLDARLIDMDFEGNFMNLRLIARNQQVLQIQMPNDGSLGDVKGEETVSVRFATAAAIALPEGELAHQ